MPVNKIISNTTTQEIDALIPWVESSEGYFLSDNSWIVTEVYFDVGTNPGYALISIQKNLVDEKANAIAFSEFSKQFKIGSRCFIERMAGGITTPVFVGNVISISHDRDLDGITVRVLDDRFWLQNIRIVGRFQNDFDNASIVYRQGWACHFNKGGRPNSIMTNNGLWVFSEPDYNLAQDEQPPGIDASLESLQTKASYWTIGKIVSYLRTFYTDNVLSSLDTLTGKWKWIKRLPSWVVWENDFIDSLDQEAIANFNEGFQIQNNASRGFARKGRDINIEGLDILSALDFILKTAGGFTINFDTQIRDNNTVSILKIIPSRYQSGGITLDYARDSLSSTDKAIVTGGNFTEDGENLISSVAVAGDLVFIETRLDSTISNNSLKAAWTPEDEQGFREHLLQFSSAVGDKGWREASMKFPLVYTAYSIDATSFSILKDTIFEGYPELQFSRPINPNLLSFRPGANEFRTIHYPVWAEWSNDSGSTWNASTVFDGLEVWDNGVIFMPAMRDLIYSWRWTGQEFSDTDGDGQVDITVNDIRITLAIPMDHRLTASASLSIDTGNQDLMHDTISDTPDLDKISPTFQRLHYIDAGNLYSLWLRNKSFPIPESAGGTQFTDKLGKLDGNLSIQDAIRSDSDMIKSHARRALYDLGRLNKTGRLKIDGYLLNQIELGTPIKALNAIGTGEKFEIRAVVGSCRWVTFEKGVYTELGLI